MKKNLSKKSGPKKCSRKSKRMERKPIRGMQRKLLRCLRQLEPADRVEVTLAILQAAQIILAEAGQAAPADAHSSQSAKVCALSPILKLFDN